MLTTKRLARNESDKFLGGVCSGLADYFGLDVTLVRLGMVVLALLTHVFALAAYVVLWIVMPARPSQQQQ
jgi:phage shock protein C